MRGQLARRLFISAEIISLVACGVSVWMNHQHAADMLWCLHQANQVKVGSTDHDVLASMALRHLENGEIAANLAMGFGVAAIALPVLFLWLRWLTAPTKKAQA